MHQANQLRKPTITGVNPGKGLLCFALPLLLLLAFLGSQFINVDSIGWVSGFSHPLMGWDHLITMLAVGIWAAQLRGQAIWMLPLAFVGVMSLGGLAGAAGLAIPSVDGVILLSCAVFSVLITRKIRFSSKINVLIVAFFAFFHGFAHGQEISASASLISYTLGFMLATLLLHGAGILVAKLVVFAGSCLLTLMFSSSALAKNVELLVDSTDQNTAIEQSVEFAESSDYRFYLVQGDAKNRYFASHAAKAQADSFSRQDLESEEPLSNRIGIVDVRTDLVKNVLTDASNINAAGSNHALILSNSQNTDLQTQHAQPLLPMFKAGYINETSLDFKHYFPNINHTPGQHFLSNGVGLTSPPMLFTTAFAPLENPELCNTTPPAIEDNSLQMRFAKLQIGNFKSKINSRFTLAFALVQLCPYLLTADDFRFYRQSNLSINQTLIDANNPAIQSFGSTFITKINQLDILALRIPKVIIQDLS